MKFIPLLLSTPMVQSTLENRKTMSRRKIKDQDQPYLEHPESFIAFSGDKFGWVVKHPISHDPIRYEITQSFKCPYGKVGDVLWIRETWRAIEQDVGRPRYEYKATEKINLKDNWKPSIFMPKEACRLFLKIKSIKVERLHDIKIHDAVEEGINYWNIDLTTEEGAMYADYENYLWVDDEKSPEYNWPHFPDPISSFTSLWKKINGKQSWDLNPFVWVIEFEIISKPLNFN